MFFIKENRIHHDVPVPLLLYFTAARSDSSDATAEQNDSIVAPSSRPYPCGSFGDRLCRTAIHGDLLQLSRSGKSEKPSVRRPEGKCGVLSAWNRPRLQPIEDTHPQRTLATGCHGHSHRAAIGRDSEAMDRRILGRRQSELQNGRLSRSFPEMNERQSNRSNETHCGG